MVNMFNCHDSLFFLREQLFFVYIHPSINIIHESRYLQSACIRSEQPPTFLRYALCALGCFASSTYSQHREKFYEAARKHLQEAEIKDINHENVTLVHAQTWILIAVFELKESYTHRWLMSISRAVRLTQLMRLHRVDVQNQIRGPKPGHKIFEPPQNWVQAEESKRFSILLALYAYFIPYRTSIVLVHISEWVFLNHSTRQLLCVR